MPFDQAKLGFSCQPKPAIWCQDTADHSPDVILQTNCVSTPFLSFCSASREEDLSKMQISRSLFLSRATLLIRTISSTAKISHTCRKKLITAPQSPSVSIRCHGNMSAVEEGGMNFLLAKYAGWPTSTI